MKEYLIKKAYYVGSKESLGNIHMPECEAELILVDRDSKATVAKNKFSGYNTPYVKLRTRRAPKFDLYMFEGRELTRANMLEIQLSRKWREDTLALVRNHPGYSTLIYSGEHSAYWRPAAAGYTAHEEEAGVYDILDAWNKISHADFKKQIHLILLPKDSNQIKRHKASPKLQKRLT